MSKVTLVFRDEDKQDPRSLVEIIIARLHDSIKAIDYHYGREYRVHDCYVLSRSNHIDRRMPWYELKKILVENHVIYPNEFRTRDEKDSDGSTHETDYANEKMLYIITQNMPPVNENIVAVQQYLADAGVLVDRIRRNPEVAYQALKESYKLSGKDEAWIEVRVDGIVNRKRFTKALSLAVCREMDNRDYGTATNDLYIGLWQRTKDMLLDQMGLDRGDNLRDNQSRLALLLEQVAEEVLATHLGNHKELTWFMARAIVQEEASVIGKYAEEISQRIGKDIPTNIELSSTTHLFKINGDRSLPDRYRLSSFSDDSQ
ncbi:MAG: hypothetical protein AAFQ07_03015 [Chloroflexota bacterium]